MQALLRGFLREVLPASPGPQAAHTGLRRRGADHVFLYIPALTQKFKMGEMLVGDKIISNEQWKAGIKKQWDL